MSEHDLATSNQFEVSAKSPSVVDTAIADILNIKIGKEYNNELVEFHYGFSGGMGRVSENATVVLGLELDYLQIQGDNDVMHIGFVGGAQLAGITNIQVTIGTVEDGLDIALVWNGTNGNYESIEITGLGNFAKFMVGGTYPMTLTDTTP